MSKKQSGKMVSAYGQRFRVPTWVNYLAMQYTNESHLLYIIGLSDRPKLIVERTGLSSPVNSHLTDKEDLLIWSNAATDHRSQTLYSMDNCKKKKRPLNSGWTLLELGKRRNKLQVKKHSKWLRFNNVRASDVIYFQ